MRYSDLAMSAGMSVPLALPFGRSSPAAAFSSRPKPSSARLAADSISRSGEPGAPQFLNTHSPW